MAHVIAANYALDWYIVEHKLCNFYLTGLYSILWNVSDYLLISAYLLHLLFWDQLYEIYTGDTLLDYSTAPQAHVTIKKVFYRYLIVIGVVLVAKESFGLGVFYAEGNYCLDAILNYSARYWPRVVYVLLWLSVVFIPGWYLYFLYKHVYGNNYRIQDTDNSRNRFSVGMPAFISQLFFLARSVVDVLTLVSSSFDVWFNRVPDLNVLFWGVAEIIPVLILLLAFLSLKKPRHSSLARLPLLR